MNELAARLPAGAGGRRETGGVSDADLDREFEQRLSEASTLAFRVAYGVLRRREDAEDVAQEAAVRAYRSFASLRNRDSFRGWLVRTAWRLAIDRRRGDRRRGAREQAVLRATVPPRSAEEIAAGRQAEERVWRALDALPEKLRMVMVLGAVQGHDTQELAALLGLPEGTVKSRLHRARQRLQELLR
jgi:RNA polymerase sigma-70 factor, ECF subfamily